MSWNLSVILVLFVVLLQNYHIYSIPACVIIDTNMIQRAENENLSSSNRSASLLLRNLRMLDRQRSSDFVLEPIPLSHIDIKQVSPSPSLSSSSSPATNVNHLPLKKTLTNSVIEQTFSPCSIKLLNEIETKMVVPFEFRRLRIEQPDHRLKYFDDDPRETVPDLSTAVYERRSDPDGVRFCRSCRDGNSFILSSNY